LPSCSAGSATLILPGRQYKKRSSSRCAPGAVTEYRPTLAAGCLCRLGAEPSTCCGSAPARCLWPIGGVIYLSYNAGYLEPSAFGRELSDDAIWLGELVARAMPRQAEAWGLLALLTFLSSHTQARSDDRGRLVLLEDQDRARWDGAAVSRADGYLATAAALGHPGRFQLQAAIAGCHGNATSWAETDWLQILTLYVDQVADRLSGYHLLHATRAQLLTALGDHAAARAANERALALTHNPVEQQLLRARLASDL
jgi:predicted RNA polymerase sigma factor